MIIFSHKLLLFSRNLQCDVITPSD